jgi:hypothetical protein
MKNAVDQLQLKYSENQFYHIQLDGVLRAAEIKWDGEVSIIEQPEDQSILVCLVVHAQELRGFLEHFQVVNLSLDTEVSTAIMTCTSPTKLTSIMRNLF